MDEDNIVLCRFGTPLEPIEEDEIPQKKPISIEDQIVTDENGKRRFHGAFTGGFSAGFWNTVGSLEGWKPQEFKSSRSAKGELKKQRPVDFMDDEDMGEFGIAPQRIQTTKDFTQEDRKRKFQQKQIGPIPGIPVLHQLLGPARDGVAIRLLKTMGWKPGQGIGSRQTRKEKLTTAKVNKREKYVIEKYGCDLGPLNSLTNDQNREESDLSDDNEVTFAPDDFEPFVYAIKDNTFGLGYSGLSKVPVLKSQQTSLFGGPLELIGKNNKKLSISGQAFGVGALEEDDEDIYQKDDLTKYDFSLDDSIKKKSIRKKKAKDLFSIEGFHECNSTLSKKQFVITMTSNFMPRNWLMRKTRFQPLDQKVATNIDKQNEYKLKGLGRHDLKPQERHSILEESLTSDQEHERTSREPSTSCMNSNQQVFTEKKSVIALEKSQSNVKCNQGKVLKLNKGDTNQEHLSIIEPIIIKELQKENDEVKINTEKITNKLDIFKPFLCNPEKQERYEKFLEKNISIDEEITKFLNTVQPLSMSEWDREMEKKEFVQASKIYTPLKGFMSDRFVSEKAIQVQSCTLETKHDAEQKRKTERSKSMWKPCSQLCKRFNIAEPFGGSLPIEEKKIKKAKLSIFNYLETSLNRKESFITPIIIPKKIPETAKSILNNQTSALSSNKKLCESESETNVIVAERNQIQNIPTGERHISQQIDTSKKLREKPKSELETKIEQSKNKHPSEKKDLFKAIFDSSSEDENDQKIQSKPQQNSSNILAVLNKPAAEINILKNNSPPRGIFAAYFKKSSISQPETKIVNNENSSSDKTSNLIGINKNPPATETLSSINKNKIIFKSKKCRNNEEIESRCSNVYGPVLPDHLFKLSVKSDTRSDNTNFEQRLVDKNEKSKSIDSWVEKTSSIKDDKSSKKKKKNKDKEKKRERKHKKHKKNKK